MAKAIKVGFVSLGCPKNQVDAEMILASLLKAGFELSVVEAEADAILALDVENTIISTGGSAVLTERGAKRLSEIGKMVYIKAPVEIIEARIGDIDKRGVAHEAGQTLRDIYDERAPIYEKYADATIEVGKTEIAVTSRALAEMLGGMKN